jgi:NTP pyrophosphatase (non-canonical NTP hydrolase)
LEVERIANIYQDVLEERARQEQLKAEGKFKYSAADIECPDDCKHRYLSEEFGEVSRELNERETALWKGVPYDSANLRAELIQVAAVAVAWVEALDKESGK